MDRQIELGIGMNFRLASSTSYQHVNVFPRLIRIIAAPGALQRLLFVNLALDVGLLSATIASGAYAPRKPCHR
jgi:hypothetical protein